MLYSHICSFLSKGTFSFMCHIVPQSHLHNVTSVNFGKFYEVCMSTELYNSAFPGLNSGLFPVHFVSVLLLPSLMTSKFLLQVNRSVEVNFSCLETTVNQETWVLVLEFIGIGGKFVNPELFTRLAQQARIEEMASGIKTTGICHCLSLCEQIMVFSFWIFDSDFLL